MADVPEPKPVDGYAYKRPLGQFGKRVEVSVPTDDSERSQLDPAVLRDLLSLVFIVLAIGAITTGITALLGWAYGAIAFGIMCGVIGVLLGMSSSEPDNARLNSKGDGE